MGWRKINDEIVNRAPNGKSRLSVKNRISNDPYFIESIITVDETWVGMDMIPKQIQSS